MNFLAKFKILNIVNSFWTHIATRHKIQACFLLLLMIISSISEVFSIGAAIPFIAVIVSPESIVNYEVIKSISNLIGSLKISDLTLYLTIIFILAVILSCIIRVLLVWALNTFCFLVGADLASKLYRNSLYQPYVNQISQSTSVILDSITVKTETVITTFILPFMNFISALVIGSAVLLVLFFVTPKVALLLCVLAVFIYFFLIISTQKSLRIKSEVISISSAKAIKTLQDGLGSNRDILISSLQEYYLAKFDEYYKSFRHAQAWVQVVSLMPRYIVEGIGLVLVALTALIMNQKGIASQEVMSTLGVLVIAAQRLLPIIQQGYASFMNMRGSKEVLSSIIILLDKNNMEKVPAKSNQKNKKLTFKDSITFMGVSYYYENNSKKVLKDINFKIKKGSFVAIKGVSGAGKSTLLDLLLGLINTRSGSILVDKKKLNFENQQNWWNNLSHVPQTVFLVDGTVLENICFGIPSHQVDFEKLTLACKCAQIEDTINKLPLKYQNNVGERGILLSGGERQRIAIARALYKTKDILILDEATSGISSEVEGLILDSIKSNFPSLTVVSVTYEKTNLYKYDKIFELREKKVYQVSKSKLN